MEPYVEPWLRGPVPGVHPLTAPVLYAFQQAREDLARHTEGLSTAQVWATPHGFGSVGFHIRHIARSTGRLLRYLAGESLSEAEMLALASEKEPGATREELLGELERALQGAETAVRAIDPATLAEVRTVGRKRLPTTVTGLLTHIAEHTQRHTGQAICAAQGARIQPLAE
jgi:uncharacterized damage-inducible protein DinB